MAETMATEGVRYCVYILYTPSAYLYRRREVTLVPSLMVEFSDAIFHFETLYWYSDIDAIILRLVSKFSDPNQECEKKIISGTLEQNSKVKILR